MQKSFKGEKINLGIYPQNQQFLVSTQLLVAARYITLLIIYYLCSFTWFEMFLGFHCE
jgi:hypothetical protein